MPLPSPKPGEELDAWISRCMGNGAMKSEFPDNKQRQAVCQQKWRDKDKKNMTDDGGILLPKDVSDAICRDLGEKGRIPWASVKYSVPLGSTRVHKIGRLPGECSADEIERRSGPQGELRVAEDDDGKMATISGYAAVFGKLSKEMAGFDDTGRLRRFREQIAKGAFTRALVNKADVHALIDHQAGLMTLARTANDTLELAEDGKGLHIRFTPPDTNAGRDIVELVRSGTLSQMSFAFQVPKGGQSWEEDPDGGTVRTINEAKLFDVSVVTYPAYPQTSVAVRSLGAWQSEQSKAAANQREINKRLLDSRASVE